MSKDTKDTKDTIRMQLPEGATSISLDGVEYDADADGCVTVPAEQRAAAEQHGLTAPVAPSEDTAAEKRGHHRK
jgi:hypothetical protein